MVKMGVCMIKSPSALDREAGLARTNGPVTHVRSGLAWDFRRSNLAPRGLAPILGLNSQRLSHYYCTYVPSRLPVSRS